MMVCVKKILFIIALCVLVWDRGYSQTASRIPIASISSSVNTGMDFSPWLNDDVTKLVAKVWSTVNNQYVDVKIKLQTGANVTKLSLYDYDGTFEATPATIYAVKGTTKTLLCTFTGPTYNAWQDVNLSTAVAADTIVVHKYANCIPQKVQIYGTAITTTTTTPTPPTTPTVTPTPPATTAGRIYIGSIGSSVNTGMDYSPWLNDDTTKLVANVWSTVNNQYVDVKLKLQTKANITKLSMYDYEGVFTSTPATIYAVNGTTKTLLGTFTGPSYKCWQSINLSPSVVADTIIVHKYANCIPEKIKIYGTPVATTTVTVTPISGASSICPGSSTTFTNTTTGGTWSSSNTAIATINSAGTATGVSAGTATITYSVSGGAATKTLTVNAAPSVSNITGNANVCPGAASTLSDATAGGTWSSSTPSVATVGSTGVVTGVTAGTSTISYTVTSGGCTAAKTLVVNVSSSPNAGTITGTAKVCVAGTTALSDAVSGGTWSSSSTAVATVSAAGLVTGVSAGSATISYAVSNSCGNTANATLPVTVSTAPVAGTITGTTTVTAGSTISLSDATTGGTWSSSTPGVATISASGVVTGVSAGTTTISYTVTGACSTVAATKVITVTGATGGGGGVNGPLTYGKIPVDVKRWYQLNNVTYGLDGLFDGVLNVSPNVGWGLALSNWDAYYPILPGEQINIDSIKFYAGSGNFTTNPFTLYYIDSLWNRVKIATFVGGQYNTWVGPNSATPNNFAVSTPVKNAKYLLINTYGAFPNEMQLYGSYTLPTAVPVAAAKAIPLKQQIGVDAFEWDFLAPNNPGVVDAASLKPLKTFSAVRHYLDWERLEPKEGGYTFNPSHSGSWNYDSLYARCKMEGIEVLADIKTIPPWMQATYPSGSQDGENVPAKYGLSLTDPKSYIGQAKLGFQFAARYGSTSVNTSLLSVDASTRWNGDGVNVVKTGLNYIKYIECDNERDKWWKGRKAYQTGREYAANMSAFYDGHKNTMGAGVGVKNADPNMQVVMAGVALASTDYFRGMIDWCKEFRGYKADGSVNLCWDVINYHIYIDNANSTQGTGGTRGAAPEVGHADSLAAKFIDAAHKYAKDMPVWCTETGYDINQSSTRRAIPIGSKTVLQVQADWILRTALLYERMGVERTFFYQTYDLDINSATNYASMGFINPDKTRKPAADYLYQTNKLLGDYVYKETISTNPLVDRYELNGRSAYVLVKPSENGSTQSYTLQLKSSQSVKIYSPQIGKDTMSVTNANTTGTSITLTVTETPMFVIPSLGAKEATIAPETIESNAAPTTVLDNSNIAVYPNPTASNVTLSMNNESQTDVNVVIYTEAGRTCRSYLFNKSGDRFQTTMDISALPSGLYIMEITQGNEKVMKKLIKVNP